MNSEESLENQIITNATELFLSKGFKSVTMDDLASSMGMSKKTIYTYFKTKNILVNEVSNYLFDSIRAGINHIISQNYNPIEELFVVNDFVQKNLKNENSSPLYQLQKYYPKIHESLMQKQFEVAHECILNNLKRGIENEIYREQLDTGFISRIYFVSITGIKNDELFPKENFPAHRTVTTYLDYHIRGIAKPKGVEILEQIQQNRL